MSFGLEIACWLWLCAQEQTKSPQDLSAFIGSDGCRAELRGTGAGFGSSLDRKQNAGAEIRKIDGKPTLLVIQYTGEKDRCGTVRDILVAPDPRDTFEFECTDHVDKKLAVIGVHHEETAYAPRWKASRAWVIDFEKLKLISTPHSVTCLNYDYSGPDDGSDIRTRAAARAHKKAP